MSLKNNYKENRYKNGEQMMPNSRGISVIKETLNVCSRGYQFRIIQKRGLCNCMETSLTKVGPSVDP